MTTRARGRTQSGAAADADAGEASQWRHTALDARPGFLIRRLHQIHVALFVEECAPEGITPVQYSILTALEQMGPSEQIALSRAVGLDRANTADVIGRLVERRFIQRRGSRTDKRKKVAELTDVGRALLGRFELDGSVHYRADRAPGKLDFGKTHFGPDANGLTASVVVQVLRCAAVSGDPELLKEALRLLRGLDKFRDSVPRGAQTWEVPLHTPDVLATNGKLHSSVLEILRG